MTDASSADPSSADASSADPITLYLRDLHDRLASTDAGEVASYIPELATADPRRFGLALASLEGHVYQAGEAAFPFTIQSVSKPFVFALALADLGLEAVLQRVGAEPSGEAFNAISLEPRTGRPANPLINAGAIATADLVVADSADQRFERIAATLGAFAGHPLEVDESVFMSERETGNRNRALAYLLRNAGKLGADVEGAVEVYFRQCSLLVTAVDLAVMAATLANGGTNPLTGEEVVTREVAEVVLTVMATCGMYDYSGEWLLRVGLPAKSGVAGGLVAVSPGQFGIGLFSPPLDARGNSVRAVAAGQELSSRFQLHVMHDPGIVARALHDVRRVDGVLLLPLQGALEFAAAERAVRAVEARAEGSGPATGIVLDVGAITRVHTIAVRLVEALAADLVRSGVGVVVLDPQARRLLPSIAEYTEEAEALAAVRR
jgi:glutaminase